MVVEFEFEELEKATENFNASMLVGKGSHGLVYRAILKDLHVAIKKPSQGLQFLGDDSKLQNEIRILSSLPRDPHVLTLLGTAHDAPNNLNLLITPFMPNGSLHDSLHHHAPPLAWPTRLRTALRIARALRFLHRQDSRKPVVIIHRDVKSSNVLFDSQWNAKLADFGLAVDENGGDDRHRSVSPPAGTIGYLDPSYTNPAKLSTKNDIFSFGVLLLEIVSGRKAIDVEKSPSSIVEWAAPLMERRMWKEMVDPRVALPAREASTVVRFLSVAARCVQAKEDDRPSIFEVVNEMEGCLMDRVIRFPMWRTVVDGVRRLKMKRRKVVKVIGVVDHDHKVLAHGRTYN